MQESISVANANKFSPKLGDKIICNNGEEFICCTKKFLNENGLAKCCEGGSIFGYQHAEDNPYAKYAWQYWDENGKENTEKWSIREVLPQSVESSADKKEEVKEEPRYKAATAEQPLYTLQEIKEAWDASGWVTSTSSWSNFQKNLTKINSPEYQEYLRLRAIYE